jgi:pyruvate formate lyase activating enzyme
MATIQRLVTAEGHPARLWEPLPNGATRGGVCMRRCEIQPGDTGWCGTRLNTDGQLFSLIYGKVASLAVSPIENKPLFHFYPGSLWLSLGTQGCNFRCPGCQNWHIAHALKSHGHHARGSVKLRETRFLAPQEALELAREHGCLGVSWTYNEPTIWFEYVLECARLAREEGLLTNVVTNGSITPEALDHLAPHLDSFRVDLKGLKPKVYRRLAHLDDFSGILSVTSQAKRRWGLWVETVTNVIPGINDDTEQLEGIASWIRDELGPETPWHVTRFLPHLRLCYVEPTAVATLERAREIGLAAGLEYVYLGNVPGHAAENTHCSRCAELLIRRYGLAVVGTVLSKGRCPHYGHAIPGRFDGQRTGGSE